LSNKIKGVVMLVVRNVTYAVNHNIIFEDISFTVNNTEKVAIIGKNGIGKSILIKLIVDKIKPDMGEIIKNSINIAYFPQNFNDLNFSSVADVFGLEKQVISLRKVEDNCADVEDYENLDGNWDCVDVIKEKMKFFGLNFDLMRDFLSLSGGEKVKLILSSVIDKNSNFLILDEPTNNMDSISRKFFYNFVKNWSGGLIVVSHDRELLNLVNRILELRRIGMKETKLFSYGGNYDYWKEQKRLESLALERDYGNSIKKEEVKKQEAIRTVERLKKGFAKAGRIASDGSIKAARTLGQMNKEKMALKQVVNAKNRVTRCNDNIKKIQSKMDLTNKIYFKFADNYLKNKNLVEISDLNFFYGKKQIFNNFELIIKNGDRIAINGKNGSGKTTLLNIIIGKIKDFTGSVRINTDNVVYLNQNCDFLNKDETILKNVMTFNNSIKEKEARDILAMFLFRTDEVFKKVADLSGGEKLRAALACIFSGKVPELILLDEPTNNMDLESIEVLENILNQYNGGLAVVSHDRIFKKNIKINKTIEL